MTIRTICVATALAAATLGMGSAAEAQYRGDHGGYGGQHHGEYRGGGRSHGYGNGGGYGHGYGRPGYRYHGGYGYRGAYGYRGEYHDFRRCRTEWRYHHRVRICR